MKKWLVSVFVVVAMAISCLALSACESLGGGNTSSDYVGKWQFQSLTEADGTEYKTGDFYRGSEPDNKLTADSFSLEVREQDLGYDGIKMRTFMYYNSIGYPANDRVVGSWSLNKTSITIEGKNSNNDYVEYTAKLKKGVLSIEYTGVYTVYLVKA